MSVLQLTDLGGNTTSVSIEYGQVIHDVVLASQPANVFTIYLIPKMDPIDPSTQPIEPETVYTPTSPTAYHIIFVSMIDAIIGKIERLGDYHKEYMYLHISQYCNPSYLEGFPAYETRYRYICKNENAVDYIARHINELNQVDWHILCENKNAVPLIEMYLDRLDHDCWQQLCQNENAISLVETHLDKIDRSGWHGLCQNENAVSLLSRHIDMIDLHCGWGYVSQNKNAIEILASHTDKIKWDMICNNPAAIDLISQHTDRLDYFGWIHLTRAMSQPGSKTEAFIPLIKQQIDTGGDDIKFFMLPALCEQPYAVELISPHLEQLTPSGWQRLCMNENAIPIVEANLDKITNDGWANLCRNKNAIHLIREIKFDERNGLIDSLCFNENEMAIPLLKQHLHAISMWDNVAFNTAAIRLIIENVERMTDIGLSIMSKNQGFIKLWQ
jgi:hypothetical protein